MYHALKRVQTKRARNYPFMFYMVCTAISLGMVLPNGATDATRRAQKLLKPYQPGKTNINHFLYDIYGKVTKQSI